MKRPQFYYASFALLTLLSACSSAGSVQPSNPPGTIPQANGGQRHAQAQVSPPPSNIYLGAWANPNNIKGPSIEQIAADMATLESSVGHSLTMHLHYLDWNTLLGGTGETVQQIFQDDIDHGRTPIISLNCSDNYKGQSLTLIDIANHKADTDLHAMSAALEALKDRNGNSLPIFIRYFWEFNINATGGISANANGNGGCFTGAPSTFSTEFKNAWYQIWNDFNLNITPRPTVSLVWNPNVQDSANDDINIADPSSYYPNPTQGPNSSYVDWIGLDGYNKQTSSGPGYIPIGFNAVFLGTLSTYATSFYGKPIMIGETGSCSEYSEPYGQDAYLSSMATILGNAQGTQSPYSYVKAVNYFHAPGLYIDKNNGKQCADQLLGNGLTEFANIANSSLFSPKITP